ncbi:hypothetical protein MRX96_039904 [Rhipicephalus microplus]
MTRPARLALSFPASAIVVRGRRRKRPIFGDVLPCLGQARAGSSFRSTLARSKRRSIDCEKKGGGAANPGPAAAASAATSIRFPSWDASRDEPPVARVPTPVH